MLFHTALLDKTKPFLELASKLNAGLEVTHEIIKEQILKHMNKPTIHKWLPHPREQTSKIHYSYVCWGVISRETAVPIPPSPTKTISGTPTVSVSEGHPNSGRARRASLCFREEDAGHTGFILGKKNICWERGS